MSEETTNTAVKNAVEAKADTDIKITASDTPRNGASTIFRFQMFSLALLILVLTAFVGAEQIRLTFIGGMICILPTIVFARLIFRTMPQSNNEQQVQALAGSLYIGEFFKLLLTIALFALAFYKVEALKIPANAIYLFAGYLVTQLSSLLGARFQQKNIETI